MALLTTAQFAKKYNIKEVTVRQNKARGNLVTSKGFYNESNEVNKLYIAKRLSEIGTPVEIDENIDVDIDNPEAAKKRLSMEKLKEKKLEEEIEKLVIQNQKMRGELVPIEMIKPLFIQYSKSMITAFQNATENVIVEFGHKKNFSLKEKAEIKKQIVDIINQATDAGAEDTKKSIKSIVTDFSLKRGRGEHG